ncbi:MAG: hypothetical protein HYR56_28150 [Acidobacteria bacterium]|nr:hypothetical protein [Acidobacteriota bacterium]MBI3422506.1 hypothetical protein [Acidobacteriota bacterium]
MMAATLVWVTTIYALLGLLFAPAFVAFGVTRLDAAARGTGLGFRLLILPGVAALWPLLLWRWLQGQPEPPVEINAHRRWDSTARVSKR